MNNISIPLDIENIRVLDMTINNDNSIIIEVESTEKGNAEKLNTIFCTVTKENID